MQNSAPSFKEPSSGIHKNTIKCTFFMLDVTWVST